MSTAAGADAYATPATGGDSDSDDSSGMKLWGQESGGGIWTPECWHKSPEQMQAEAKAMNRACFEHAAANAAKHSNPPAPSGSQRLL